MNTETLSATARNATGKGGARKVRQSGKLPAIVYRAGTEALPIAVDSAALTAIFRHTQNPNTLIRLDIDGAERICLVKDVQRHPVSKVLRHVDFYEVDADELVHIAVPVLIQGTAAGAALGGTVRIMRRTLDISCKPADIPAAVTIDVTPLNVADFVKVSQIDAPEGCTIHYLDDFNVVTVVGKREEIELEGGTEGEDEEAEGTEPESEA